MTTVQIKGRDIVRPDVTPLTSSVLDHVAAAGNLVTTDQFGRANDEGLWPSYNCLDTLIPTPMCPDPSLTDMGEFKEFSTAGWQPGFTFANQAGVQCSTVGLDVEDQRSELRRVFEANEGKGVEQALLFNRFVATGSDYTTDLGVPVSWEDPVDVTPGTAVSLAIAVALLEGYAAIHYAGVPTLHLPRAAVTLLADRIVWRDGLAYTKAGSKVAIGGGYDGEVIMPDGNWTIYATGEIYVERSETVDISVTNTHKSYLGSDESGISSNTVIALVERMYRVGVDCFVAKATGKVW